MKARRTVLLLLAAALAALLVGRALLAPDVPRYVVDPAIEFHTQDRSPGYGGIDRWAYYGMKEETFINLLKQDGYVCRQSQAAYYSGKPVGIGKIRCTKQARWPLPRLLAIEASIDYDRRGRLVAAHASYTPAFSNDLLRKLETTLREMGWIEPESLPVRGLGFASADLLARRVVDLLTTGGWTAVCEQAGEAACAADARKRRAAGFPTLPSAPVNAGEAMRLHATLERAYLLPPVARTADGKPEDSLLVRVDGARIWLDFAGKDLAGRDLAIAIELDSAGGSPLQLVASVGEESRAVALTGAPRRANDGRLAYLVPEAGEQAPRSAVWLHIPQKESAAKAFAGFGRRLADIDPAFMPKLVGALVSSLAAPLRADEHLGLYPALNRIDALADDLRAAGADRWLPPQQRNDFIGVAHRDDPALRAAWALALCESGKPTTMDRACWESHVGSDVEVRAMLQQEVASLLETYASLDTRHPIRVRLNRLGDVLPMGGSGS